MFKPNQKSKITQKSNENEGLPLDVLIRVEVVE